MKLTEKTLDSKTIFEGKIIRFKKDTVQLENGVQASREVVMHPGGVCVIAMTEQQEVLMVRQFRYPYNKVLLEIPAGKLNYGEDPRTCGIRELEEETGAKAESFSYLGCMFPTPAYLDEVIHMYLAAGLSFGKQHLDEDEFLTVEKIPLTELVEQVMNDEIPDAKTQIALLKTARMLGI